MPDALLVVLGFIVRYNMIFFLVGLGLMFWRQGTFGGRRPPDWIGTPIFICYALVATGSTVAFMVNPTNIISGIFAALWIYWAVQAWGRR